MNCLTIKEMIDGLQESITDLKEHKSQLENAIHEVEVEFSQLIFDLNNGRIYCHKCGEPISAEDDYRIFECSCDNPA